ncbi:MULTISPECIES: ABC transporter substrate-binding protein [unclassified Bacillus (in: firmicutes)]|uniref:ABC transporter substrate-binding protein n=1 Tax=unclassified Bacillus (in: firmicutes) TaxID=185979 RepID=UPI0008F2D550|nr:MULTISPECIES: ABC transporter substrate-binding protein [unclassified Bacillus (in: firmicutes)]SFB20652.1 carbohydrate ABC transporter substrate-binding protein, CUT1 family [Bacillus sp. UNCCL13]SFQ90890.1 carbohydrate ABC transporter substrate-binding protein, CUT1 family [Bacillus sp. cl95]
MKKGLLFFLTIILLISTLAGCSQGSKEVQGEEVKENGKTVVNFWSFWGSETRRPIIEKIIKDFNDSQDDIIVKHTFLPWGDIWTKNLASVAAGNPADVIINDINSVAQRAENEQVEDITKYIDPSFEKQFYPHLWDTVVYKNKTYAVPFNTDTRLLFYNKKAFKEAGLDPNKPPQTWDELEEYAKKLDVKSGNKYERIGFYPLWGNIGAASWMTSADEGKGFIDNNKLNINTPKKVEALEWVMGWQERLGENTVQSFKSEFGSEQANPFIAEKVAMWVDVGTFYTQIRDYGKGMEFGVAPIPSYKEGSGHFADGGGFVAEVPKGAKHPKEAMEFIKYLTGLEAQKYWAMKNFDNVANIEAAEATSKELKGTDQMVYQATVKNLEKTKMYPVPVEYPDYNSRINPNIDNALLGKVSAEKALKNAEEQVEKMNKK